MLLLTTVIMGDNITHYHEADHDTISYGLRMLNSITCDNNKDFHH